MKETRNICPIIDFEEYLNSVYIIQILKKEVLRITLVFMPIDISAAMNTVHVNMSYTTFKIILDMEIREEYKVSIFILVLE